MTFDQEVLNHLNVQNYFIDNNTWSNIVAKKRSSKLNSYEAIIIQD
jgi:hypothetical protein